MGHLSDSGIASTLLCWSFLLIATACSPLESEQGADSNQQEAEGGYTQLLQGGGVEDGDERKFKQALPGKALQFPIDHGEHPGYRIEWWYLTANLEDETGAQYGVQFTLFRSALAPDDNALAPDKEADMRGTEVSGRDTPQGWDSRQIYMAHAALTTPTSHYHAEKFVRGGVGLVEISAQPFVARIEQWQLATIDPAVGDDLLPLTLRLETEKFTIDLTITGQEVPVLHGLQGFSQKHPTSMVGSYYYSLPHLALAGDVTLKSDTKVQSDSGSIFESDQLKSTFAVTGEGWLDREWSSQYLASDQLGWDWLSLHLDDGRALMAFRLRQKDGEHFVYGTVIDSEGNSEALSSDTLTFEPVKWQSVDGKRLPLAWRVIVMNRDIDITVAALHGEQFMDTLFPYWEGVVLCQPNERCRGYLELTGYE